LDHTDSLRCSALQAVLAYVAFDAFRFPNRRLRQTRVSGWAILDAERKCRCRARSLVDRRQSACELIKSPHQPRILAGPFGFASTVLELLETVPYLFKPREVGLGDVVLAEDVVERHVRGLSSCSGCFGSLMRLGTEGGRSATDSSTFPAISIR